jgi:signal transduction histidine kinase
MRNQILKSRRSAEQSLLGGMALASLTAACIWLVLRPAPEVADYLIAVALLFALFLASLIVMHLVGSSRKQMEAALESQVGAEQHAIEALRESETQWKEAFEHNPVMYFKVDAEGAVLSVNTYGAAQLGNLHEARGALVSIVNDANRADEVIQRVRALVSKTTDHMVLLDINEVVNEVIILLHRELFNHRVSLRLELAPALGLVLGDRIQMQQIVHNLVINGIEAMQLVADRPRELVIRTRQEEDHQILVAVRDCGVGLAAHDADRLFDPFFITKFGGMGMGLSICRSIVESHDERLSASSNVGPGATFQFSLPMHQEDNTL